MSEALIEKCRKTIVGAGLEKQVRFVLADARDLGNVVDKDYDLWLNLFYKISTEMSIIGASRHLLYIGVKK